MVIAFFYCRNNNVWKDISLKNPKFNILRTCKIWGMWRFDSSVRQSYDFLVWYIFCFLTYIYAFLFFNYHPVYFLMLAKANAVSARCRYCDAINFCEMKHEKICKIWNFCESKIRKILQNIFSQTLPQCLWKILLSQKEFWPFCVTSASICEYY